MTTQTLKLEDLIAPLRDRAATHRAHADNHRTDPDMAAFYQTLALQCDQEARSLECRQLLTAVQEDPFMAAMQAAGATEIVIGRSNGAENGLKPAPRCVVRAGWPHTEIKAAPATARRWPF